MSKVNPKVGTKYLIKGDYETNGGGAFHQAMKFFNKHPLIVERLFDEGAVWVEHENYSYIVRNEDLIPYRTAKLENK